MTTANFTPEQASRHARFRRFMASFLFAPIGRFNILTLLGATAVETALLFFIVSGTWMDSTLRTSLVVTAIVPVLAAIIHFARTFGTPYTDEQRQRILIAESGNLNPARIVKKHPDRVAAYRRLRNEIDKGDRESEPFHNASELILAGKLTEDDTHFITAAIQQGAVTTEEIETSVADLRRNSVIPLLDGLL